MVQHPETPDDAPAPAARTRRWSGLGWGLVAVLLLVAAGGIGAVRFGDQVELASFAAARVSARLGRAVSAGSLRVTPGRWVTVVLRDVRVDNRPGGSRPAMAEAAGVTAEIEAVSLLHGPLNIRRLEVDGLDVLLEHVADGTPNWRFGVGGRDGDGRAGFPTLSDARLVGTLTVRTRGGTALVTEFDGTTLHAPAPDQPVRIAGPGSYRGVPIQLDWTLGSVLQLRDVATPYPADLAFSSGATRLRFKGTLADPLAVDGARGTLTLDAPTLDVITRVAGIASAIDPGLHLSGAFERQGPAWSLADAAGGLGDAAVTGGALRLDEGAPGVADRVSVTLAFDRLDLNAVLGGRGGSRGDTDLSLAVERAPDPMVTAALTAKAVSYAGLRLSDVRLMAAQTPGRVAVEALTLTYMGGHVQASGRIEAGERGDGRVSGEVDVTGLDAQALRQVLELGSVPVMGRLDGRVAVIADGTTLNRAARGARLSAVVAMAGGSIAREVIELASTNPLALLRTARGMSAVACGIAIVDVRGGVGTVTPLRVRAADGTIVGRGSFDLYRRRMDLVVASESRTTSALALDVPLRVSGGFAGPSVAPARLSGDGRAQLAAGDDPGRLLPGLQAFARRRACGAGG